MKFKCPYCEFLGNAEEMIKHFGYRGDMSKSAHPGKFPPSWTETPFVEAPEGWIAE